MVCLIVGIFAPSLKTSAHSTETIVDCFSIQIRGNQEGYVRCGGSCPWIEDRQGYGDIGTCVITIDDE